MFEISPGVLFRWLRMAHLLQASGERLEDPLVQQWHGWDRWGRKCGFHPSRLMQLAFSQASVLTQSGFDLGPFFFPTIRADDISQGQQGIDVWVGPMHPGTLQAGFDHQLVGAFHNPTPDRPALFLELRILELCLAFLQISLVARNHL